MRFLLPWTDLLMVPSGDGSLVRAGESAGEQATQRPISDCGDVAGYGP